MTLSDRVSEMRGAGSTIAQVSAELGISRAAVWRASRGPVTERRTSHPTAGVAAVAVATIPLRDQYFSVFPTIHRCFRECGFERIDRSQEESDAVWAEHRAMHRRQARTAER